MNRNTTFTAQNMTFRSGSSKLAIDLQITFSLLFTFDHIVFPFSRRHQSHYSDQNNSVKCEIYNFGVHDYLSINNTNVTFCLEFINTPLGIS